MAGNRGKVPGAEDAHEDGVTAIAAERANQLRQGWTPGHDADHHVTNELATVAMRLLQAAGARAVNIPGWADMLARKHATNRGRLLRMAGAFVAAEIDRDTEVDAVDPVGWTHRPVINRPKVERVLDVVRHRLLRREVETEIRDGEPVRFLRLAPDLVELLADVADAGLQAMALTIRQVTTSPGDLLVLQVPDPRHVPMRAVNMLQEALEAAVLREGLDVDRCGRLVMIGPDASLSRMTSDELAGLGLQFIPTGPVDLQALPPEVRAKIEADRAEKSAELAELPAAELAERVQVRLPGAVVRQFEIDGAGSVHVVTWASGHGTTEAEAWRRALEALS